MPDFQRKVARKTAEEGLVKVHGYTLVGEGACFINQCFHI